MNDAVSFVSAAAAATSANGTENANLNVTSPLTNNFSNTVHERNNYNHHTLPETTANVKDASSNNTNTNYNYNYNYHNNNYNNINNKMSLFNMFAAADKLDLSGLLNVLDGVVDTPGRIVVMTTPYP